jgi:hypothetical protein
MKKKAPLYMEAEGPITRSEDPAIKPYPEPYEPNPQPQTIYLKDPF